MPLDSTSLSVDDIVLTRNLTIPGDRAQLYRAAARGEYVRLTTGAYLTADAWNAAHPEERHRAELYALAVVHPEIVFGAVSAALAWHRPLLGAQPTLPESITIGSSGGRSNRSTRTRGTSTPFEVVEVAGLPATSLARSLVDAARVSPLAQAVAMLDHALAGAREGEVWPASERTTRADLESELARGTSRGRARARHAIQFADGAAQSPGESWSRVLIEQLGFPRPRLQQGFSDAEGFIGVVDFYWHEFGLIGEFDGKGKYLRDEYTRGQDAAIVVLAEKRREDRLRSLVRGVSRWGWEHLREPWRLRQKLQRAGLPCDPTRHPSAWGR